MSARLDARSLVRVKLGDICEFKYGKSLAAGARNGGSTLVFGSNGVVGRHDAAISQGATIIIGRKGSLGEVNYSSEPCWPIDTTYYVDRTCTNADLRWLYYRLDSLGLTEMNRAAAVPGLNRDDAYRLEFLLPPLPEQRRIADILDKAEALRAQRREALGKLEELVRAVFLEMFGDPVANDREWPARAFDETMRDETSRSGKLQSSEFKTSGRYPVIDQGQSVIAGYCDDETLLSTSRLPVIVFGDHTRAVKLVTHPFVIGADGAKVLAPQEGVDAVYLAWLMRQMPIPSLGYSRHMREVKRMVFPIPPLPLQQDFARRVEAIDRLKDAHRRSLVEMDALFASLQHRAFRGEL